MDRLCSEISEGNSRDLTQIGEQEGMYSRGQLPSENTGPVVGWAVLLLQDIEHPWLIGKDPDAGRDWRQEEKGTTEDETAGWHHWLKRHGFGWTPGVGDGQGGLACCGSWGHKELDTTEWLNWTELSILENDSSGPCPLWQEPLP